MEALFMLESWGKKKFLLLVLVPLLLFAFIAGYAYYWFTASDLRRELPWAASEIKEQSYDLFPDYSYFLKAKMPEKDFAKYVGGLGLTLHTSASQYGDDMQWLHWPSPPFRQLDWWNPTPSLEQTYVQQAGHEWTLVKYEDGYVYATSYSH
jgi:hypothetical protein